MADIEKINPTEIVSAELLGDLRQIIDSARSHVAATANYELTAMYWHIGDRINRDVLKNERAEYGKQIVSQVATQLQEEYGTKGFEERTIRRMMQFALQFPDFQIVSPLVSKLSWTHFVIVMPIFGSAVLSPQVASFDSYRPQTRSFQSAVQGSNGVVSALVGAE